MLFDDGGFFKKENNKSSLTRELEKVLITKIELQKSDIRTCLIVDVMLIMRRLAWKGCKDFKDLAENFCKFVCQKASK